MDWIDRINTNLFGLFFSISILHRKRAFSTRHHQEDRIFLVLSSIASIYGHSFFCSSLAEVTVCDEVDICLLEVCVAFFCWLQAVRKRATAKVSIDMIFSLRSTPFAITVYHLPPVYAKKVFRSIVYPSNKNALTSAIKYKDPVTNKTSSGRL